MSVLIKSVSRVNRGYPPMQAKNIYIKQIDLNGIHITYDDPDDTIVENITLVTWAKTVLVRNDDHIPDNINDGIIIFENTTRNKYSSDSFIDTNNLVLNTTYYYRFFTYSTENIINTDLNYYEYKFLNLVDFNDATWETIHDAINNGIASDIWNIGDTKVININPCLDMTGGEVEFMIAGFDIPRVSGNVFGSKKTLPEGEHNICLVQKYCSDCLKTYRLWTAGLDDTFEYYRSGVEDIANDIRSDIPLEYMLKCVEGVYIDRGVGTTNYRTAETYFTFLTGCELGISFYYFDYDGKDAENTSLPIFTDNNSRIFTPKGIKLQGNEKLSKYGVEYWTLFDETYAYGYPDMMRFTAACHKDGRDSVCSTNNYINSCSDYIRLKCFIG